MNHIETATAKALINKARILKELVDDETGQNVSEAIWLYQKSESTADNLIGWICFCEKWLSAEANKLSKEQSTRIEKEAFETECG